MLKKEKPGFNKSLNHKFIFVVKLGIASCSNRSLDQGGQYLCQLEVNTFVNWRKRESYRHKVWQNVAISTTKEAIDWRLV